METLECFGKPQRECQVCGKSIAEFRVLKIKITAKNGGLLADLQYDVPLCEQHRGDEGAALNVEVSWAKELRKTTDGT